MAPRPNPIWRSLLTLVVLACVLMVAVLAANPLHGHNGAPSNDCSICQAGHLPLLGAQPTFHIQPVLSTAEAVVAAHVQLRVVYSDRSAPSRAPPSTPLCILSNHLSEKTLRDSCELPLLPVLRT